MADENIYDLPIGRSRLVRTFSSEYNIPGNEFNDLIERGLNQFNHFVHSLLKILVEQVNFSKMLIGGVQKSLSRWFDESFKVRYYAATPAIYIYGGAAYRLFDSCITFLNLLSTSGHARSSFPVLSEYSSRTNDYDIRICLEPESFGANQENTEAMIKSFLIYIVNTHYKILNHDNYINDTFDDITRENIVGKISQYETVVNIINNKILISLYKDTRTQKSSENINFRISVGKNIDGILVLEHIVELIFTINENKYHDVNKVIDIRISKIMTFPIPDINSLIYLSLESLVNRANRNDIYLKCKKDFFRLNYFFKIINLIPAHTITFYGYIRYTKNIDIYDFFKYIVKLHPYCSIEEGDLTQDYFKNVLFQNRIAELLTYIILDLRNPSIYYINLQPVKDEIKSIYLISKRKELIKTRLGIDVQDNVTRKYLKYKQKYLKLKLS